jgi:ribosome-binding factor A
MADITRGTLVTVTAARVSPDLGYAKIYISVFPFDRSNEMLEKIKEQNWLIRRTLGGRIRNQLKIVPELEFFIDDSLEYIENIDNLLSK